MEVLKAGAVSPEIGPATDAQWLILVAEESGNVRGLFRSLIMSWRGQ